VRTAAGPRSPPRAVLPPRRPPPRPGWRAHPDRDRGTVTVLAAALVLVAAVLTIASVDVARVLGARARAQTAADAAALAAAQELAVPSGRDPAQAAAEYGLRNGGTLRWCRCEPGTEEAVVEVAVEVRLLFFGGVRDVLARARAVVAGEGGPVGGGLGGGGGGGPSGRERVGARG
jgi:secretion/DNA translocation related TadE-like protein